MLKKERLLKLRKTAKITQLELAKSIGIDRTTYGRYENGEIQPPSDMIVLIANYFNVTTDYLLGLSDTPVSDTPQPINVKLASGDKFTELDKLPEDIQKQIMDYYIYHVEKHRKEKQEQENNTDKN